MRGPLLTDEDLEVLLKQETETLVIWYGELNCWNWPEELPDPQTEKERFEPIKNRGRQIMQWIEWYVGERAISHYHLTVRLGYTEEYFQEFQKHVHDIESRYHELSGMRELT